MLELVHVSPNWRGALSVALVRPTGVPERRHGEDPWEPGHGPRPRRLTDDLAWLRGAVDEPEAHGLQPLNDHGKAVAPGCPTERSVERLRRLRDRAVLEAAGFQPDRGRTRTPAVAGSGVATLDSPGRAGVAQLVEHLICNQAVRGSSPLSGSPMSPRADERRARSPANVGTPTQLGP